MKNNILSIVIITFIQFTAIAQFHEVLDVVKLGSGVNSAAEENMPVISKDGSMLYFTRTFDARNTAGENDQDIWFSIREENGDFSEAIPLKDLNNKFNNAVFVANSAGDKLYVINSYEGKKDMEKGIAVSKRKGDFSWGNPEKIEIPDLVITGDFYSFFIDDKESVIIVSYEGPNSKGKEDLYVVTKKGGAWTAPVHMGDVINTSGFEMSPFLTSGNDTLFFSSNGHGGEGDADIFYSVKQGDWTKWSAPVNLGPKINSPKFDAYFVMSGANMYWSSNREAERSDIFYTTIVAPTMVELVCSGTNVTVFGGSDGKLSATASEGVPPYTFAWSNGSTEQNPQGVKKGEYTVVVTDNIGQTAECTVVIDEPLPPKDIALKHFFDYNADKLTVKEGKLKSFVDQIVEMLGTGRDQITVEIVSSASKVPTSTFGSNDRLAQSRANNMKKELDKFFKENDLSNKITVVITQTGVNGPDYDGDFQNQDKYREYQFIELKTK